VTSTLTGANRAVEDHGATEHAPVREALPEPRHQRRVLVEGAARDHRRDLPGVAGHLGLGERAGVEAQARRVDVLARDAAVGEEGDDRLVADHLLAGARHLLEPRRRGDEQRVLGLAVEADAMELLDPACREEERAGRDRDGERTGRQPPGGEAERDAGRDREGVRQHEHLVVPQRLVAEHEDRRAERPEPERPDAPPHEREQRERRDREPRERRRQGEHPGELVPADQSGDPPRVDVVGDRARPDRAQVACVDGRDDGEHDEPAADGLEERPDALAPERREHEQRRQRRQRAQLDQHGRREDAAREQRPPDRGEPERPEDEHHRRRVRVDPAPRVRQLRRDGEHPDAREAAERAREAAAEQEGEDGADRVERDDPEPHVRDAGAEHGPDPLQEHVEARHLGGEDVAAEGGAVAQVVEADEVDALVEGRPRVQQPRQQDDVCGDEPREGGELGRDAALGPAPAGDHARALPAVFFVSQSTRPSQRSRLAAYHAIVRLIPSSHETRGCQPVSACSLS
jgi:hypothetical protein